MVKAAQALCFLLTASLFAGCVDDDAPTDSVVLPDENGAIPLESVAPKNVTADSGFLIPAAASPEGALTGSVWKIPKGAFVPYENFPDWRTLTLEIIPEDVLLDGMTLYLFEKKDGDWSPVHIRINEPMSVVDKLAALQSTESVGPSTDPFFIEFLYFDSEPLPSQFAFVVAARGNATDFGLGLHVVDHVPDSDEEPTPSLSALRSETGDLLALPATGTGSRYQSAVYQDISALAAVGLELWTDDVSIVDRIPVDARPTATVRDVTFYSTFEGAGWGYGTGMYIGYESHGTWSVQGDVHGNEMEARGVIAQDWAVGEVFLAEAITLGLPVYLVTGSGDSGTDTSFSVTVANVDYLELLLYYQFDLGADLETLIGDEGIELAYAWTSLVGDIPPQTGFTVSPGEFHLISEDGPTIVVANPAIQPSDRSDPL